MVAHTLVVGASLERKVTGKKANVILAAHLASQAALRLLKPGNEVIIFLFTNTLFYQFLMMKKNIDY